MALKKITYNGSSKVIIRLCEVVNDLIDRGSGGHTIQNSSGTDMTARTNLQFTGASVSDDAVNDRTVVDVPTYSDATQSASGLMSASDKTKLDGIASGAEVNVQSNWTEADNTSDAYIANKPNLATVATSGLYSDLSGTPSLATVATSGSYNDLSNKPTIPTVNDATLTLTQGGSTLGTFTANASSNVTIDVPRGAGHTIWDRVKTALTSRSKLWFKDANVTDASADGATKVEVVTELASENAFDALATDGSADGIYTFPDSGEEYLTADMVGYGAGTVKTALDALNTVDSVTLTKNVTAIDANALTLKYCGGRLHFGGYFHNATAITSGTVIYTFTDHKPSVAQTIMAISTDNNACSVTIYDDGRVYVAGAMPAKYWALVGEVWV